MGTTLAEIKVRGWKALVRELGYSGATKFILIYESGKGDYTEERKDLLKDITVDDIVKRSRGYKKSRRAKVLRVKSE